MNRIGMAVFSLFFISIGGHQALRPAQLIRYNMNRPLTWQPRWMRERALSAPNVWMTRIAGAICCLIGIVLLTKAAISW